MSEVGTSERWWKWLNPDRRAIYGSGQWPEPGVWTPTVEPVICRSGWHVVTDDGLVEWCAPELWVAEVDGDGVTDDGRKWAFPRARLVEQVEAWDDTTARLFAADCAERVLHLFEAERPGDDRPRKAVEAARAFARGEIDDAAWDAARDAARDDAWDAAWAAAWAAARDAAWAAANAGDAARDAERQWQTERLLDVLGVDSRRSSGADS